MTRSLLPNPALPDDYEGKNDAETLAKAEEIRSDRKRHARAKRHLEHIAGRAQKALAHPRHRADKVSRAVKAASERLRHS